MSVTSNDTGSRQTRKGKPRDPAMSLPPDWYFRTLRIPVGASKSSAQQALDRTQSDYESGSIDAAEFERVLHAYEILSAWYRRGDQHRSVQAEEAKPDPEKIFYPPAVQNAYRDLGLPVGAGYETVRAAFRRLAEEGPSAATMERITGAHDRIVRYIEHQADRAVVLEMRVVPRPDPPPQEQTDPLRHYRSILGVKARATIEEIDLTYAMLKQQFEATNDPAELERRRQLGRAYEIVRRMQASRLKQTISVKTRRRLIGLLLLTLIMTGSFAWMNRDFIRSFFVHFEQGEVVYMLRDGRRYGTIVGYDPHHQMAPGAEPRPAYKVRLRGTEQRVWIVRRAAVRMFTTQPPLTTATPQTGQPIHGQ